MRKTKIYKSALFFLGLYTFQILNAQESIAKFNWLEKATITVSEPSNQTINKLTDKDDTTFYIVRGAESKSWIQCEIDEAIVLTSYTLVSTYEKDDDPQKWRLEYSEDGLVWKTLHIRSNQVFPARNYPLNTKTGFVGGQKGYRFFKLSVENPDATIFNWGLAELQFFGVPAKLEPNVTSNGGVLTSTYSEGNGLANLIDNTSLSFTESKSLPFWVQYESSEPIQLEKYTLVSGADASKTPRAWELYGSNDGESWDILDVQRNRNFLDASHSAQTYGINPSQPQLDWEGISDQLYNTLITNYWKDYSQGGKFFIAGYDAGNPQGNINGYNYWWQAHGLDIFVDRYTRNRDVDYQVKINALSNGVVGFCKTQNLPDYYHGFYDDMEWLGLAFLRNYEVSKNQIYMNHTLTLWNWIKGGWSNVQGGGIAWSTGTPNGKNACSNAPAIILACRLYATTGQQDYLDFAKQIYTWMDANLIDPETGYVADNKNEKGVDWTVWSYNVGTWIGGCLELYLQTGDKAYLDKAIFSADNAIADLKKFSKYGVVTNNEDGGADGGLFKGIFVRYFAQLILKGDLDDARKSQYIAYLIHSGESLWNAGTLKPEMTVAPDWFKKPVREGQTSSTVMSGVMLFEALTELKHAGLLDLANSEIAKNAANKYKYFRLNIQNNAKGSNSGIELSEWQLFDKNGSSLESEKLSGDKILVERDGSSLVLSSESGYTFSYRLVDLSGKIKYQGVANSKTVIPISHKGVYIISGEVNGHVYNEKVVL